MSGSPSTTRPPSAGSERARSAAIAAMPASAARVARRIPSSSRGGLPAPAVVEEALVGDELDAVAAERVGVPERERAGDAARVRIPSERDDLHGDRRSDVVEVDARAEEVVRREGLGRDDLDRRVDDGDPVALDAPDDRDPAPADLRVDERVADVDRDLVPQLRTSARCRRR